MRLMIMAILMAIGFGGPARAVTVPAELGVDGRYLISYLVVYGEELPGAAHYAALDYLAYNPFSDDVEPRHFSQPVKFSFWQGPFGGEPQWTASWNGPSGSELLNMRGYTLTVTTMPLPAGSLLLLSALLVPAASHVRRRYKAKA